MKNEYNLDTLAPCGCSHCKDWKKGFEKELEYFMFLGNMGKWIMENEDAETIGKLLIRFIREQILGEEL